MGKRLTLFFQILTSKYWTSYLVFGCTTFLTILLLTIGFYLNNNNFKIASELINKGMVQDMSNSFYYIVVTFTTLGYGDISPINISGQVFAAFTAISGYIFLAIFIILIGKKINTN
jgi:Ion channel